MKLRSLEKVYRVTSGKKFRLDDIDPGDTHGLVSGKREAEKLLASGIERLRELQTRLYAANQWGVLLVFQAMDAAGKDSTISHVMSGVNPQGCEVHSFKVPSATELDHDYLWRTNQRLPPRGSIGIFNRSYYEEVLAVRVHDLLTSERLPPEVITKQVWEERYEDIRNLERYVTRNGIVVRKFFLHVSKEEQRRRFLARLDDPTKRWKFSLTDVRERARWDDYMEAYEDAIRATATPYAPWYVVPADHKWFTRCVVAAAIVDALEDLDLGYPKVDPRELAEARRLLAREK